ncbi:TPA: ead/Ea22-like family protein [Escherichia coli]|nr:ead/Ea22-like family protein [Escherichia coli]HAX5205181.1 ead/Ea22-like family protein [Escherichia coli]
MSNIDYQTLREAAEAIRTVATIQKLQVFRMKVTPSVVLVLLDELEVRNKRIAELNEVLNHMVNAHKATICVGCEHIIDSGNEFVLPE